MEPGVLVAGEQIEQRSLHAGKALEVAQACRVDIDAAQAIPFSLYVADHRLGAVEALGSTAEATAKVEVVEAFNEHSGAP
ncbi:hypothetical protein D3C78_1622930 [compost metagenome]